MRFQFVAVFLLGLTTQIPSSAQPQAAPGASDNIPAASTSITYHNAQYGFCLVLPANWKGYTVITKQWQGTILDSGKMASGPKLLIRHPGWTKEDPYEDIPVMIFTPMEWQNVLAVKMSVSAAPIGPEELGHNRSYVFALPPRYNFDELKGWQEVDQIMQRHPLHAPCERSAGHPAK